MIILIPFEVAAFYAVRVPDLRQGGKRWRGPCPIHAGQRDSFSVDPATGLWRCWSDCGRGGDIISLEIALTGVAWLDAVTALENIVGRRLLDRPASHAERRALAARSDRERSEGRDVEVWGTVAKMLAGEILEQVDAFSPSRADHARLVDIIRKGGAALIDEYRIWQETQPELTRAMVKAGVSSRARVQRLLAFYLREASNAA